MFANKEIYGESFSSIQEFIISQIKFGDFGVRYCVVTAFLETAVYGTIKTVCQPLLLSTDQTSCHVSCNRQTSAEIFVVA